MQKIFAFALHNTNCALIFLVNMKVKVQLFVLHSTKETSILLFKTRNALIPYYGMMKQKQSIGVFNNKKNVVLQH